MYTVSCTRRFHRSMQDEMEANLNILDDDQEAVNGLIRLHQRQLGDFQVRHPKHNFSFRFMFVSSTNISTVV